MSETENQDRQHPLYHRDRIIVDNLLVSSPTDYNLAELARLRIRLIISLGNGGTGS